MLYYYTMVVSFSCWEVVTSRQSTDIAVESSSNFLLSFFLLGLSIQSTRGVESNDIRGDGVLANTELQP